MTLHPVGEEHFDLLFFLSAPAQSLTMLAQTFVQALPLDAYATDTREFMGQRIHEAYKKEGAMAQKVTERTIFSYLLVGEHLVGSFSPLLVEEVARTMAAPSSSAQADGLSWVSTDGDQERLYLTAQGLSQFFGLFVPAFKAKHSFQSALLAERFMQHEDLYIAGSLSESAAARHGPLTSGGAGAHTSIQTAANRDIWQLVPEACMSLWTYSFADAHQWNANMLPYWSAHEPALLAGRLQAFSAMQLDISSFFRVIGHRAGVMHLVSADPAAPAKIFFMEGVDKNTLNAQLLDVAQKKEKAPEDLLVETYHEYDIRYLPVRNVPYLLFGRGFDGFSELYYTFVDDVMMASSSLASLRTLLESISARDTWQLSSPRYSFLKNTIPNASVGLYVDWQRQWQALGTRLASPFWQEYFKKTIWQTTAPSMMAFEVVNRDDKLYAHVFSQPLQITFNGAERRYTSFAKQALSAQKKSVSLAPKDDKMTEKVPKKAPQESSSAPVVSQQNRYKHIVYAMLGERIIAKPKVIYYPEKNDYIVFLQTQDHRLYASVQGKLLWELSLNEEIISPIYPIDYHRNNQKQYLFATPTQLHILRQDGKYTAPFPMATPAARTQYLSLLDYDKNRKYRFLLADATSKVFLADKKGIPLPGWQPKILSSAPIQPPFHARLPGRDVIITLQEGGILGAFRRNGNAFLSFPVDFHMPISDVFVTRKNTWQDSQLTFVTAQGELMTIDFMARVHQKKPLPLAVPDATFGLVKETLGRGFLFYRWSSTAVSFFNASGEWLFEKRLPIKEPPAFQFYNFSHGEKIIVLHNKNSEKTYFYGMRGSEVLPSPVDSSHKIGLIYNTGQREYVLYGAYRAGYFIFAYTPPAH